MGEGALTAFTGQLSQMEEGHGEMHVSHGNWDRATTTATIDCVAP